MIPDVACFRIINCFALGKHARGIISAYPGQIGWTHVCLLNMCTNAGVDYVYTLGHTTKPFVKLR